MQTPTVEIEQKEEEMEKPTTTVGINLPDVKPMKIKEVLLPAAAVVTGVALKMSVKNFPNPTAEILEYAPMAGVLMFCSGWAGVARAMTFKNGIYQNNVKSQIILVSITFILVAVLGMQSNYSSIPDSWRKLLPLVFGLGWLGLGFGASRKEGQANKKSNSAEYIGLTAGALVIASMLFMLPWQRKYNMVDGLGLPVFVVAWFALSYVHAM